MAFSKTNVTLENLTPELAKQFSAMPGLFGERPIRPSRLAFLDHHRRNGTFVSPSWAVVVDQTTGQRYRANGQHSSTMLAQVDGSRDGDPGFPVNLLVTIEEFTTDNLLNDALPIFDLFDHPRAARTNTDIMGIYRARYEELEEIDLPLLVALTNGVAYYEDGRGTEGIILPPRERGGYLTRAQVRDFVQWAASYDVTPHGWMFKKAGVVAEMFANIQAEPSAAKEFWRLVLTESHPDPEHETRELSRVLRDWSTKPRIRQDRFRREAARHWRRYRRSLTPAPVAA
jgi:hypothetical protein